MFYVYESHLLYNKRVTSRAVRDASRRYYVDKLEPYFTMGRFLHESFKERSTIYSLKELLERLVVRARDLRTYDGSRMLRTLRGRPPTSHFHVLQVYDSLLSTLELNFFLTKYYVMRDRDGREVSVYALNHGLCEKHSIEFGRPTGSREQRTYFIERIFDYRPILQDYIATNQEIRCNACRKEFDVGDLEALRRYNMLCPECHRGTCQVTNISRKYEYLLRDIDDNSLLPATELGILQTLRAQNAAMFAGEIAGELDVSAQLVGWRGKRLAERDLLARSKVKGLREFTMTDLAKRIYFSDSRDGVLDVGETHDESEA